MKIITSFFCLLLLFSYSYSQDIKGTYAIKNVKTGMLLRIKDANGKNGTPLVAYGPQNWKCMTWDFQSMGDNTYQLKNLFTKKTFQPLGEAKETVALEEQPLLVDAVNQQYEFIKVKKDTYLIRLKATELYLTPADADGSTNSAIVLAKKKNSSEQQWIIYLQNPTI
ncbi:RICIN domain-containing protein [Pedobacter sp. JCM 36344]|uniref:RICIN domain-containing protein n=1 Tax=Pedobacter sp. JCM 36344 TaxID=3374280 RepID=UPI0039786203